MKGHRFYEILEAHRKGEDLSVFVPTNPAEAELLANLAGGTGGGSAMPPYKLNNAESKVYYGQYIGDKTKLVIDFAKYVQWLERDTGFSGRYSDKALQVGDGSASTGDPITLYLVKTNALTHEAYGEHIFSLYIGNMGVYANWNSNGFTTRGTELDSYEAGDTLSIAFNKLGIKEINLPSDTESLDDDHNKSNIITCVYGTENERFNVNLNEAPIDFMWFE